MSLKIRQACNWTEMSLLERQEMSFDAKLGDFKVLKRHRTNLGNWMWNPLANLWTDQALTEFDGFEFFYADTTDETKICLDKICSLILSEQF